MTDGGGLPVLIILGVWILMFIAFINLKIKKYPKYRVKKVEEYSGVVYFPQVKQTLFSTWKTICNDFPYGELRLRGKYLETNTKTENGATQLIKKWMTANPRKDKKTSYEYIGEEK